MEALEMLKGIKKIFDVVSKIKRWFRKNGFVIFVTILILSMFIFSRFI